MNRIEKAQPPLLGWGAEPTKPDGWNSTHPIFAELVAPLFAPVIIEVGTWHGKSAIEMAKHMQGQGNIYCVDTWLGALEFWTGKLFNLFNFSRFDGNHQCTIRCI